MCKKLLVVSFFLLVFNCLSAEDGGLHIRLIHKNEWHLSPGTSTNIAVNLENSTDSAHTVKLRIDAPEGWNQLGDYSTIVLEPQSKRLKILSFFVAKSTPSANYRLKITLINQNSLQQEDELLIPVFVKPRFEILAQAVSGPDFVLAGDTARVSFIVRNNSNTTIDVSGKIPKGQATGKTKTALAPDSMYTIDAFMITPPRTNYLSRNSLSLHLYVEQDSTLNDIVPYIFKVIPSQSIAFDRFQRLPIQVSTLAVTNNRNNTWNYATMFDIKGGGLISTEKERYLSFHFRGPDRKGNPLFGQSDMYSVKYSGTNTTIKAGDDNYNLSYLTESSRNGRGLSYEHQFNSFTAGGFVNFPRYYPRVKRLASVFGAYAIDENTDIHAGYLNKTYQGDSTAHLLTVNGKTELTQWLSVDGEFALGAAATTTSAYRSLVYVNLKSIRGYINYAKAMKDFPGYFSNSQYFSSGLSTTIKKISLSLRYNLNHSNLALDTLYSNAPESSNLHLSGNYRINKNHSIGIGVYMREREDKMESKLFHFQEQFARISLNHQINKLRVRLSGEVGKMKNILEPPSNQIEEAYNGQLYLSYQPNNTFNITGFVNYRGGNEHLSDAFSVIYYGGAIKTMFNKVSFYLRYRNDYTPDEYYKDRSLVALSGNIHPGKRHHIGLGANYNLRKNTINSTAIYANFRYGYTLNLPVARKGNTGSIKGKILNQGIETVEGIMCTLGGNTVVTDKNGGFEFPVVKKGSYYLWINYSNTGMYTIAERPGPYQVDIIPGEVTNFEIALTKSGIISGKIVIQEDENKDKPGYIPNAERLGNLIVEAKSGKQVFRKYSSGNGNFTFDHLIPGKWQVKVYKQGIPSGYELLKSTFTVDLEKGETEYIDVEIKKYNRKIQFQKSTSRP